MHIRSVTGVIAPDSLGITLSHEHLVIDLRCAFSEPPEGYAHLATARVTPELLPQLRQAPQSSHDNLVLEGDQSTIEDLKRFRHLGGKTIVDLTSFGLSPNPSRLRELSLESGVQVIAGCGYYRHFAQTPRVLAMTSAEIADLLVKSILCGIGDTDVRAGIIGEVGTSFPLHPFERESLVGAAQAQRQTGVAINVHPDIWGRGHLEVLDILEAAGADPSRTVMSHMDEITDSEWHCKVADRGVYLSFDTFGSEFAYDGIEEPKDADRIRCLKVLLDKGYAHQLLLSQDVCYKIESAQYGGGGYCHVLASIVPQLRGQGVSATELHAMLVDNPKRVLTTPDCYDRG